ncbi:helix-turn-helix transcriptional regulator [Paenibacillus luteus]|uniref:helix-turn-helix transcriptional regulator n=1 Tax=Paenibacillus luteus TaxID=2545753 RepID=UPI0011415A12|nr:helix-turn-helix transcriptional regulator [Paenibacillus luteus]
MTNETSKSKTMGAFLKSRRERLQPAQAGIASSYGNRRTPGLRREEVAMLAGVSATYYTWLEQGREVTASKDIIESIGKALQLTHDERMHLYQLWNPNELEFATPINTTLNPHWRNIIEQLPYPAFISNERCEVLAWNRGANHVIADFDSLPETGRNMIRMLFLDKELSRRIVNWDAFASYSVAVFRTYHDKHQDDPWFKETVELLSKESVHFEAMWKQHDIQLKKVSRVLIQLPGAVQASVYDIQSFGNHADYPELNICIYMPILEADTDHP